MKKPIKIPRYFAFFGLLFHTVCVSSFPFKNLFLLVAEIDRVMKKVDEGVEIFDEVWEKVYSAEQQNQKEKYEGDLKKEIKKLQRLRDQIKAWIGGTEVKDKEPLFEARRLIETKMEQFKICEKETKTKTYSKEGLARQDRLSPEEQAKYETTCWIGDIIERLSGLVDEAEIEVEKLSAGKGKKTNKHLIDDFIHFIAQHKYHMSKLEGIIRLVNNDVLDVDSVDPLKDDLEYYIDSYDDEDYVQAYDEDFFYEALGLDELDVVNVDRVTQALPPVVKDIDNASNSTKDSKENKKSKKVVSSVIPLTIGRARVSSSSSKKNSDGEEEKTPKKLEPVPTTIPAARPAPPPPVAGASMAAILKRETEQQEKERQMVRALNEQLPWT
jgi:CCR4-NOT transcription complex subunit 3